MFEEVELNKKPSNSALLTEYIVRERVTKHNKFLLKIILCSILIRSILFPKIEDVDKKYIRFRGLLTTI